MAILSSRNLKKGKVLPSKLQQLNLAAAFLYLIQAVLLLILSASEQAMKPITSGFLSEDKAAGAVAGSTVLSQAYHHLFDLNLAYVVAAFLLLGAVYHLLVATRYRKDYETGLKNRLVRARWLYMALSLGLIMVTIAMLSGIYEFSALVMIFTLTEAVALSGYLSEKRPADKKDAGLVDFGAGLKAGVVVWFVILVYVWGAHAYGNGIPGFVYFIYLSALVLYGALIINSYLQIKKMGHWEDYLFGEKSFIIASFIAISAIAWQVFAGILR